LLHGVIFASFRDFATRAYGRDLAEALFADEPPYLLSEAYDDERFFALVRRAAEETGVDQAQLEVEFGIFTGETTFAGLYPGYFSVCASARDFLLTVESRIHELVRATVPNASPPQLVVAPLGEDAVEIRYSSPRRLCTLVRGLAEGTARRFDETTEIVETSCARRGDEYCRFEVRLSPRSERRA
jgi:heme-NO-binding protein